MKMAPTAVSLSHQFKFPFSSLSMESIPSAAVTPNLEGIVVAGATEESYLV